MSISLKDKITIDGQEKTFKEWSLFYGIIPQVAQRRVNVQGLDPIEAITKPVDKRASCRQNSLKSYWRNTNGKTWLK